MTCVPQPSGRRCSSCSASLVSTRAASVAILRGDAPPRPETTSGPAAPSVVNSFQQPPPPCTQTIHSPLVRGINCETQARGRARGERDENDPKAPAPFVTRPARLRGGDEPIG